VHHHGKEDAKGQRGTISRLDNVTVHIKLERPKGYVRERDGAKFVVQFDKGRTLTGEKVRPITMQLMGEGDEPKTLCEVEGGTKRSRILALLAEGLSAGEIAEKIECAESYVSKIKKETEKGV